MIDRNPIRARGLREILDEREVDVFFGFGFPNAVPRHDMRTTAGHLLGNDAWIVISRSVLHTIWLRRDDTRNLERLRAYYEQQRVPFDTTRGFESARVLAERRDWAIDSGMVPAEYDELVAAYEAGSASRDELRRLAVVLVLVGAHEEQLEVDFAYEEAHGSDAGSLRRIVFALLRLELYPDADETALQLSATAPHDPRSAAVAKVARQFAFHRVRQQLQGDVPLPVAQLDRFPLLDLEDQQWVLDAQRTLSVSRRTTAP